MKTIVFFSGYSLPHLGGIEKYTKNLTDELLKEKYRVINVSSNYQFKKEYQFEENNVLNLLLPVRHLFVGRYPIPRYNREYRDIIKTLDKEKIDAIIVNTRFHLTTLVGVKYAKKHNIPVYLIEHGSQHLTVNNKVLDFFGAKYEHLLTKIVEKRVDYNYCVSKAACEWQKHFKINSDGVWYNSINDFSKDIILNKNKDKKVNICYAGRIIKQKGLDRLLNSFIELSKKYNNLVLNIAGDGEYLSEIKKKYSNNNINFLGKLDFNQLKDLYSYTDIFVYAPIWPEGLPTSILEAGLMKCAIIGSPQGGIKEVIENEKNGLMINNEKEIKEALERLINDRALRNKLSNKIYDTVKNNFLWSVTAKKVINDIEKGNLKYEKSTDI